MQGKKLTSAEFVAMAKSIHGDKYIYDKANYINSKTKVLIGCPIHGYTFQFPSNHLKGCGCLYCYKENARGKAKTKNLLVFGIGHNDYNESICCSDKKVFQSYNIWAGMLKRCYWIRRKENVAYDDCKVCDEWLYFSNFKKWFDDPNNGYRDGYHLDKDILVKGNKIYSPDTCCFVPQEINKLFTKHNRARGKYPIGVKKDKLRYISYISLYGKQKVLGMYDDELSAFMEYKKTKENYIKEIAYKYFNDGKITQKVYDALMNYQVDIND